MTPAFGTHEEKPRLTGFDPEEQTMNRYRVALALGRDAYEAAVNEDVKLLENFGLKLLSVDECVRAAVISELRGNTVHPWNVIEISTKVWDWLRPLLLQLRELKQPVNVRELMAAK
jgi:hypothetical protein